MYSNAIIRATEDLLTRRIPDVAKELIELDLNTGINKYSIAEFLHDKGHLFSTKNLTSTGVNLRHMGSVLEHVPATQPLFRSLLITEMAVR